MSILNWHNRLAKIFIFSVILSSLSFCMEEPQNRANRPLIKRPEKSNAINQQFLELIDQKDQGEISSFLNLNQEFLYKYLDYVIQIIFTNEFQHVIEYMRTTLNVPDKDIIINADRLGKIETIRQLTFFSSCWNEGKFDKDAYLTILKFLDIPNPAIMLDRVIPHSSINDPYFSNNEESNINDQFQKIDAEQSSSISTEIKSKSNKFLLNSILFGIIGITAVYASYKIKNKNKVQYARLR